MRRRAPFGTLLTFWAGLIAFTASADSNPPIWRVDGRHNSVYLLASVHVLRASDNALPESVLRAYNSAKTIYMEVDLDDLDPTEPSQFALERGVLPEEQSLMDILGPEQYGRAHAQALALGVDLDQLAQLEPWVVAITIAQMQFATLGLDPQAGVEQRLAGRAKQDGKEIRGLETLADQLGALDALPMKLQGEFLIVSLDEAADMEKDAGELISDWARGDTEALAKTLVHDFDRFPDLYRSLIVDRNRKWADEIGALLDDDQNYLIVVGALHLVGDDSVIELLRTRGHPAKRQ
jgi:uncharacterized protein YbaP (TraB family)